VAHVVHQRTFRPVLHRDLRGHGFLSVRSQPPAEHVPSIGCEYSSRYEERLPVGHHRAMESLNFADIFVTFLALLGPQKILLSFHEASRRLDLGQFRVLAVTSSVMAAAIGALCALTAPWLTSFFHISHAAVLLAGGSIFFIYAVTVMFGLHLDAELTGE